MLVLNLYWRNVVEFANIRYILVECGEILDLGSHELLQNKFVNISFMIEYVIMDFNLV